MDEENLHIEPDGHMYLESCHDMYGLKEAVIIDFIHLVENYPLKGGIPLSTLLASDNTHNAIPPL